TLYDVTGTRALRSIDGFALGTPPHAQFVTVLDPSQENVVLHPLPVPGAALAAGINTPAINLDIARDSLADYAYVLVSQDPVHSPLRADPSTIQTATQKG